MVRPTPSQIMAIIMIHMLGFTSRAAKRNSNGAKTVRKMTIRLPDIDMNIASVINDPI